VNPNDDAGGTAVAMRLSATAKRSGSAATNLNNAVSILQNQDGALKVAGKIVERISELQSLYNDSTKNSDDKALYDIEFTALRGQLTSLSQEKFNGVNLFGSTSTDIITSAAGDQSLTITAKGLNSTGAAGTASTATSSADFTVPVSQNGTLTINGVSIAILTTDTTEQIKDKINAAAAPANVVATTVAGTGGPDLKLKLTNLYYGTTVPTIAGDAQLLTDLKLAAPVTAAGTADTRDNVKLLLAATSLGNTSVSGVDSSLNTVLIAAQNDLASYRANNGAEQSGLSFASELLVLNRTNLEAAVGRIVDVDVADESTQLAKWTTLTQAGTAMLAQANQATSLVLKLIQ
jgi:flagellin-like hook-associated protein FlgL